MSIRYKDITQPLIKEILVTYTDPDFGDMNAYGGGAANDFANAKILYAGNQNRGDYDYPNVYFNFISEFGHDTFVTNHPNPKEAGLYEYSNGEYSPTEDTTWLKDYNIPYQLNFGSIYMVKYNETDEIWELEELNGDAGQIVIPLIGDGTVEFPYTVPITPAEFNDLLFNKPQKSIVLARSEQGYGTELLPFVKYVYSEGGYYLFEHTYVSYDNYNGDSSPDHYKTVTDSVQLNFYQNNWTSITVNTIEHKSVQYAVMPTASEDYEDEVIQYVGATNANYTNGYFYKCVSDGASPATYSWQQVNVQPDTDSQASFYIMVSENNNAFTANRTPSEVKAALTSGKVIYVGYDAMLIPLLRVVADSFDAHLNYYFIYNTGVYKTLVSLVENKNDDTWDSIDVDVSPYSAVFTVNITGSGTVADPYVSDKTPLMIKEAYNSGRVLQAVVDNTVFPLHSCTVSGNNVAIQFGLTGVTNDTIAPKATSRGYALIGATNTWSTIARVDYELQPQVFTMPTASADYVDKIYQFVGTTYGGYTKGYFYRCKSQGGEPLTYAWERIDVQPIESPTFTITLTGDGDSTPYSVNKTPAELEAALTAGKVVQINDGSILTYQGTTTISSNKMYIFNTCSVSTDTIASGHSVILVAATSDMTTWTNINVSRHSMEIPITTDMTKFVLGADNLGRIVQYVGNSSQTYHQGYFYKCVSDGAATPTYSWQQVDVQPKANYDSEITEIKNDIGLGGNLLNPANYEGDIVVSSGITFTKEQKGIVNIDGTSDGNSRYHLVGNIDDDVYPLRLPAGTYQLAIENSGEDCDVVVYNSNGTLLASASESDAATFTINDVNFVTVYLQITASEEIDDLNVLPMLCKNSDWDGNWYPYSPSNAELNDKIEDTKVFMINLSGTSANYSIDKTPAEVLAAVNAGRAVMVKYLDEYDEIYYYPLTNVTDDRISFYFDTTIVDSGNIIDRHIYLDGSDSTWNTFDIEERTASGGSGGGYVAQGTAPSDISVLWIDTANGGLMKYYNGSSWVAIAAAWT